MDKQIELQDLVGGALQEKFAAAFEKVVRNLQDVNTSYKVKRAITIKLSFTQNETRDDVQVDVDVVEKLAPAAPIRTQFEIGKNLETGEIFANEYGRGMKGQMSITDYGIRTENTQPAVQAEISEPKGESEPAVDESTSEILTDAPAGQHHSEIIDFRKKAAQ